ncbi:RNA ligase partner, MJ_0950 family [Candidatus Methanoperedens nitroreducens]|uniref:RNA-free ribonuclease P n=1 Tax=Candidatus Methanoperedens nitratireducens TaxID=1392998 RepID=A0A062V5W5_9EURY|nr:RNA ligase partner protein [Candidatus Methanoperedens nitroreducens]KCZ70795.1 RNA ligase partner, MJ_0950 family [Candidatus Methanoperedens nitroreducens]MDJ1420649.1 RNA ligase partner protein [Candidatus Methanoperedens sp.]
MIRQRFVLDTSALTDTQMRELEGGTLCTAMGSILDIIAEARLYLGISCYIPFPSVYNELREFSKSNGCDEDLLAKIDTWLVKKTPDRYEVKIPAKIFYDYVDFMRGRINKGMDVAEEAIWAGATECLFRTTKARTRHEIEPEIERHVIGEIISKFRDKYRNALRYGILDSAPDIDVLLLAKELDAAVVASDMGIQKWAEQLGLRFVNAKSFPAMIREYLKRTKPEKVAGVV